MPEVFFSLGATELSGEGEFHAHSHASGEREDLWHQGYNRSGFLVKEAPPL